jgi:hypothetical protein
MFYHHYEKLMILLNMLRQIPYYLKMYTGIHELRYFYCTKIFLLSAYLRSVFKSNVIYHRMYIMFWDCFTSYLSKSMQWLNVLVNTFRKNGFCTEVRLQDPCNNKQRVKNHSAAALSVQVHVAYHTISRLSS